MSKNLQSKSSIPAKKIKKNNTCFAKIASATTFQNIRFFGMFFHRVLNFLVAPKAGQEGHHLKSHHDKYRTCQRFDLHLDHNRYRSPIVVEDAWNVRTRWSLWPSAYFCNMGLGVAQITYSVQDVIRSGISQVCFGGVFRFRVCFATLF